MDTQKLEATAKKLISDGKGILAADESNGSIKLRFDAVGISCDEESRRQYRQILVSTPDLNKYINGVIFYDETFWQSDNSKKLFRKILEEQDILPGIKVDLGLEDIPGFPGEKVSKGLDTLTERIAEYAEHGARFAKWRSVIAIGDGIPTNECIGANTFVLARYARMCQEVGIVPIVEPEVLFDGTHTVEQCEEVMHRVYEILMQTMRAFRVHLPGTILKTGMVLPGKKSGTPIDHNNVAERTVRALHEKIPPEMGGVVFLSGGQTPNDAFSNLSEIIKRGPHPWGLTFSYSRSLHDPVLKAWAQKTADPHQVFVGQLEKAVAAVRGEYTSEAEHADTFVGHSQDV